MIKAIVTDIEGTTTSINFVTDELFPYAATHLHQFVLANQQDRTVSTLLDEARAEANAPNASITEICQQLIQWIDADKKVTPLKTLQGLIWADGYNNGELKGHVYEDANEQLRQWHKDGIKLYVYSSGSVKAQQLLFENSLFGDLHQLFTGNFDTHIGHKREPQSYQKILTSLGLPAHEVLFLSDISAELDAAKKSGLHTLGVNRPPSSTPTTGIGNNHQWVSDFRQIDLSIY